MNRREILIALGASAVASPAGAVSLSDWLLSRRTSRKPLLIAGSGAMAELNQGLIAAFSKMNPDIDAVLESGSSKSALIALKRGSIDVAAMDRDLTESEDEEGLLNFLVARDGVDIVVSRQSPISMLTSPQVRGIFEGNIGNWAQVGGPDAPIEVVASARGTPSRHFMEDNILEGGEIVPSSAVCDSSAQLVNVVAGNPRAIGFVLLNDRQVGETVRMLSVDGVDVSRATILSSRYPFIPAPYCAT